MKNYDIILIHPPRRINIKKKKYFNPARGQYLFIPMGIFAIANILRDNGYGVQIINYPLEEYLNPIMVFYINRVKYIRIFYNFAVPKWYQKIN